MNFYDELNEVSSLNGDERERFKILDEEVERLVGEVCSRREDIDWNEIRESIDKTGGLGYFLYRLFARCMELNPDFDESELGDFLSEKLYVSVSDKSLSGMMQRKWRREAEEIFGQLKDGDVVPPDVCLDYLLRSGFTEEDVESFHKDFLEGCGPELSPSVLERMREIFTVENVFTKKADIMLDSARRTMDILDKGGAGNHVFENVADLEICKIEDIMRDSLYKDWLLDFGYRECGYICDDSSFIVVLNDGRIMSGSNIMIREAIIDAVADKYEENGVSSGKWKDLIHSGLHRSVVDAEGQFIGYLDGEMLNIGVDDDMITVCTPDRFGDMLQHNELVAKLRREEIDRFMEQYPGLSEIITSYYGSVFDIPRIDHFVPAKSDNGCQEYGIHKCEVVDRHGIYSGEYYFYEQDGKFHSLLPLPVSSATITSEEFDYRTYLGESIDYDDFTVVDKGLLSGQVEIPCGGPAHFVVDMESKASFFFKDGKEYSKAAFCKEFLDKKTVNEIKL